MARLFIAIDLPDPLKDKLTEMTEAQIPGTRWCNREQFHITLVFIGEVEFKTEEKIKEVLKEISFSPFSLTLKGVGTFPVSGSPNVLWVGIEASEALQQLKKRLDSLLEKEIHFKPEKRSYKPHLTLARFKKNKPKEELDSFLQTYETFASAPIPVENFVLYSSLLTPTGAKYNQEQIYPATKA